MANSNTPSVDSSSGRSMPVTTSKTFGGGGNEDVSTAASGGYAVKSNGAGKGRPVGDDGRPTPNTDLSFSGR